MFGLLKKIKNNLIPIPAGSTCDDLFKKFDVFYVCYDEPNRGENWQQIKTVLPRARKVEGVEGFDRALKTCAEQSTTKRFFLIDGDNQVLPERFLRPIPVENPEKNWVLSWSSANELNGLIYGNGGLKLWPVDVALKIKTHENAGEGDRTDYCFVADYFMVDDYMTKTKVTSTPAQAFRAGIREGVKMTLVLGKQVEVTADNYKELIAAQNFERLKIWCQVGADCLNGLYAIYGARLGVKLNVIERFDEAQINSYQWIDNYLENSGMLDEPSRLQAEIEKLGDQIAHHLGGDWRLFTPKESEKFKSEFKNPVRSGLMMPK